MTTYSERWRDDEASWRSRAAAIRRMAKQLRRDGEDAGAADCERAAVRLDECADQCARFAAGGDEAAAHRERAANHRAVGHLAAAEESERLAAECDQRARGGV